MLAGCYSDVPPGSPEKVSDRLVELVQDRSPDIRRTAVESLGKIGQPLHASTLTRMLSDPDPHVREASAIAVGRLQDSSVDQVRFVEALTDSSEAVRSAVARTLGDGAIRKLWDRTWRMLFGKGISPLVELLWKL